MMSKFFFTAFFLLSLLIANANAQELEKGYAIPYSKIAKAAISQVMGRDAAAMNVKEYKEKGVWLISYIRETDKTKWSYLVKFIDNRIIWASAGNPDNPNYIGRWRDNINDEIITYEIKNDYVKITEKYSDGSYGEITLSLSDL